MKSWFGLAYLLVAGPALAADVATCTLGADRKTVTVTASNPVSQVMACEVTCDMAIPGGFSSITVEAGTGRGEGLPHLHEDGSRWARLYACKGRRHQLSRSCSAAAQGKASKDEDVFKDDDDDKAADALMQKMQKIGEEMLQRQKQK